MSATLSGHPGEPSRVSGATAYRVRSHRSDQRGDGGRHARNTSGVQLSFTVGVEERHQVDFHFNKFWGYLSISVDGTVVRRDFRLFSLSLVKAYELTVGDTEQHAVRIEKTRPLAMAGFRRQPVRAFVDGRPVAEGAA